MNPNDAYISISTHGRMTAHYRGDLGKIFINVGNSLAALILSPDQAQHFRDQLDAAITDATTEQEPDGYSANDLAALNRDETQSGECWTCDQVFINGWDMVQHIREAHNREPRDEPRNADAITEQEN